MERAIYCCFFVSLAPSFLPASLYLSNRSFRQTDWKCLDLRWTKRAGQGGGGLVPLQDNYNLVAATATLSPTSLPTHTHSLNWTQATVWKQQCWVLRGLYEAAFNREAMWGNGGQTGGKWREPEVIEQAAVCRVRLYKELKWGCLRF